MATATKAAKTLKANVEVNGVTRLRVIRNMTRNGDYTYGEVTTAHGPATVRKRKRSRSWEQAFDIV